MSYPSKEIPEDIDENGELQENELELIQGGQLTPEQIAEVEQLAKKSGKHHGINVPVTILGFTAGTIGDFGCNAAGEAAGKRARKDKNKSHSAI